MRVIVLALMIGVSCGLVSGALFYRTPLLAIAVAVAFAVGLVILVPR